MDLSFTKTLQLRAAKKRWEWCYWTAYLSSAYTAVSAFIMEDATGNIVIGFDPYYSSVMILIGGVLGCLAWRIHKRLAMGALIAFIGIIVLSIISMATEQDTEKDVIVSTIIVALLVRGIFGLRELRMAYREATSDEMQSQQEPGAVAGKLRSTD